MRTIVLLVFLAWLGAASYSQSGAGVGSAAGRANSTTGYVGSKTCAECHRSIYNAFSRTDMGRSMSLVTPAILGELPNSAEFFVAPQNRHFSVAVRDVKLYASEWETDENGKDVFRETQPVEWLIGAGANGMGVLVRQGDQIFEAPVTYYAKLRGWALPPGYEDADRGFSRPIDTGCITCHSGRPNPVVGFAGKFQDPPFDELAIGCENCHGPGAAHVHEMRAETTSADLPNTSIVNPGKISPWLADNVCMSCHQTGDARVPQPGKTFQDFRPGQPLDRTLALLMVPPTPENPPRSDLVQQYFSMKLSKCYRSSGEKLSCITCHNPHIQPSREKAPEYYRQKCLTCHSETSCTAPLETRQKTTPPDDCVGCHMPKRDVTEISHASLTNHRIVATPDEPFPDITFQLATDSLPDVVHLDAIPGQPDSISPSTLLQAYGQLGTGHREYMQRYFDLGKQLEALEPNDTNVLEALAAQALQLKTADGDRAAIGYLSHAIERGSSTAWDFETLGSKLLRARRFPEAIACLQKGIQRAPYDAKIYTLLAEGYAATNQKGQAAGILTRALQLFPQMDLLRAFLNQVRQPEHSVQGNSAPR